MQVTYEYAVATVGVFFGWLALAAPVDHSLPLTSIMSLSLAAFCATCPANVTVRDNVLQSTISLSFSNLHRLPIKYIMDRAKKQDEYIDKH